MSNFENPHSMSDPELEHQQKLILSYLDGTLSSEELAELETLLKRPQFQQLFAQFALDEAELRTHCNLHRHVVNAFEGLEPPQQPTTSPTMDTRRKRRGRAMQSTTAAIIAGVILVLMANWWQIPRPDQTPPDGTASSSPKSEAMIVDEVTGKAVMEGKLIRTGTPVQSGRTLQLSDDFSEVKVRFRDGTLVQLAGKSTARFEIINGQKRIDVTRGTIAASVQPQPKGRPLLIFTNETDIEVIGTKLAVTSNPEATELVVSSGKVQMTRRESGESVNVESGKMAFAYGASAIQVIDRPTVPTRWSEDFLEGIPAGWQGGVWKKGDEQTPGVVALQLTRDWLTHSIHSVNAWTEGLVKVTDTSTFNMRFKMNRPDFYQILLVIRDPEFYASESSGVYEFQVDEPKTTPRGEWITLSVPLTKFKRNYKWQDNSKVKFADRFGGPPAPEDIIYRVIVSSQEYNPEMEIDRIWITDENGERQL